VGTHAVAIGHFSTLDCMRPSIQLFKTTTCLYLAYLCYDSAPGGASLLPDKTHRVKLPENPTYITLSGQNDLLINGSASTLRPGVVGRSDEVRDAEKPVKCNTGPITAGDVRMLPGSWLEPEGFRRRKEVSVDVQAR